MRFKNDDGTVRTRSALIALALVLWTVGAFAETYESTPIPGVQLSTDTYAVSFPLIQLRQVPADLSNPSGGELWNHPTKKAFRGSIGGATASLNLCLGTTVADSTELANPTSNTTFSTFHTFAAGQLTAGKRAKLKAWGYYKSVTSPAKNLAFTLYYGSAALATTGNVSTTTTIGAGKAAWQIDGELICRTAGASGTQVSFLRANVESGGLTNDSFGVGRASGSMDTVAANRLELGANFDASDAGNAVAVEEFSVELLN